MTANSMEVDKYSLQVDRRQGRGVSISTEQAQGISVSFTRIEQKCEAHAPQRKRGRPATGQAMSDAERQERRRQKLANQGKTILPPQVVSTKVAKALEQFVQFKDMTIGEALDKIVGHRLLRNRSGKRKPKEAQAQEVKP